MTTRGSVRRNFWVLSEIFKQLFYIFSCHGKYRTIAVTGVEVALFRYSLLVSYLMNLQGSTRQILLFSMNGLLCVFSHFECQSRGKRGVDRDSKLSLIIPLLIAFLKIVMKAALPLERKEVVEKRELSDFNLFPSLSPYISFYRLPPQMNCLLQRVFDPLDVSYLITSFSLLRSCLTRELELVGV